MEQILTCSSEDAARAFAAEAFHRRRLAAQIFWQELQGHLATQLQVFGAVDHAMPPPITSRTR
jgi:hypothetical protein